MDDAYMYAAILALLWIIAARYYSKRCEPSAGIAQVSVNAFEPAFVRTHRVPDVLDEALPSITDIIKTTFKYEYVYAKDGNSLPNVFQTSAMFTLLHASHSTDVDICPGDKSTTCTRVKMSTGRVLILPPRWFVRLSTKDEVSIIQLYDPATLAATFGGYFTW